MYTVNVEMVHSHSFHVVPGNCSHGDIRLVSGRVEREGRVEICVKGIWGTICDNSWDVHDASVVCRQLGYPTVGRSVYMSH